MIAPDYSLTINGGGEQEFFLTSKYQKVFWYSHNRHLPEKEFAFSTIYFELNGERAVFHRPHPEKVTDKGAVKSMRKFLDNAGVKDDDL